ncbi:hypothetical protein [Microbacterium luticocti]|uniref:hypothetical protein n=1 Tax=Microbacterium luticocti TaxID=451764 RepID=UPI0003F4DFFA|nr:hypothetical protein [Microbacterium luticocti]
MRLNVESGWHFGGTLSAALDVDAKGARAPWTNAVRSESYQAKWRSGHEGESLICSGCADRFVFANGPRIPAALVSFLNADQHTVSIAELRARYAPS